MSTTAKIVLTLTLALCVARWLNAELELATLRDSWLQMRRDWGHEMAENVMLRSEVESLRAEREVYLEHRGRFRRTLLLHRGASALRPHR